MRPVPIFVAASLVLIGVSLTVPVAAADNCYDTPVTHADTCWSTAHHGCRVVGVSGMRTAMMLPMCEQHCVGYVLNPRLPGTWLAGTSCVPGTDAQS